MKKRAWEAVLALLLCTAFVIQSIHASAVTSDRDTGVQSVHMSDSQIENSTLVIGSYLIHINGLTDEIYELAKESANLFNQNEMYYKSELADGSWFEITDATSIADITSKGTPVSASVIENLEFTHKVDASGTITDLRTGATVGSYDINDPYDLENMQELEPIKLRYQFIEAKETKTESDDKNIEIIGIFYGLNIKDATTDDCDRKLTALEQYKNGLTSRQKPATWTSAVDTVMASVDAQRRVQSLTALSEYLDSLMKKVTGQEKEPMTEEEYDDRMSEAETSAQRQAVQDEYDNMLKAAGAYSSVGLTKDYQVDSELVSAVSEAKSNVENSITSYTAKLLVEGTTTTSKAIYQYSNDLINSANNSDTNGADIATENLVNLTNIMKSIIADASGELNTLNDGLLSEAFTAWRNKLAAGVSPDYQQAAGSGASQSVRNSYLTEQKSDTNAARMDYQALLEETWKRMANEEAQQDALDRIDGIPELEALVPSDDAETYQLETVAEHLTWLRKELAALVAESGNSSELDRLKQEKDDLERQKQDALDKNDLAKAKRLDAEIDAKQQDMDDLSASLTDILNSDSSSGSEKAKALADLADGSTAKMLNDLAADITSGIRDGSASNSSDLLNKMAALSALSSYDPSAAASALGEIKDALNNASDLDSDLADQLSSAVSDAEQDLGEAGSGTLSTDQLKNLLADIFGDYFGGSFGDSSSTSSNEAKAAALIALSMYAEDTENTDARALAASLAGKMAEDHNAYIYEKYEKDTDVYVSLKAVSRVLDYRYIFDNAHYTVTLSKGKIYDLFTSGKTEYMSTGKAMGTLEKAAGLQSTLYIPGTDSSTIFDCDGYYVPKCNYASVRTSRMESEIQRVYQMLMEGES